MIFGDHTLVLKPFRKRNVILRIVKLFQRLLEFPHQTLTLLLFPLRFKLFACQSAVKIDAETEFIVQNMQRRLEITRIDIHRQINDRATLMAGEAEKPALTVVDLHAGVLIIMEKTPAKAGTIDWKTNMLDVLLCADKALDRVSVGHYFTPPLCFCESFLLFQSNEQFSKSHHWHTEWQANCQVLCTWLNLKRLF